MTLSDLSVRRPVLAAVASLLIVVFGLAGLTQLPIRELPNVDSSVVTVTTQYPGAAPEIVDTDITEIVEGAVAGIAGVRTISSESRRGRSRTTIEFETGRDIDQAANDVRDAVGRVRSSLPDDVDEPRVVKNDADADPVMRLAVTSDMMTTAEITDYVDRFVLDRLATVDGVASINVYGDRPFAIRIWLNRREMAARNLTVADVEASLRRNNVELPAGEIESRDRQIGIRLDSRLSSVEQFRNIVIDRIAGYPVKLGDIARIEAGVSDDTTIARSNGREAVGLAIVRQSQSNTIAISNAVRAEIELLRPTLPAGMDIEIGSDDAIFVGASIREVIEALGISLVLVVVVILLFLMSVRATLVPAITIPVALIGCFLLIQALGFSINVLTLLALLLAIGLVVDDAIVVLENIQRRIDLGESPLVASVLGSRQVTFAVLATSATLIAVFVPLSFLPGQVGRLFVEFGFVMASAVAISTFVALTACPALASKVLSPSKVAKERLAKGTAEIPEGFVLRAYRWLLERLIRLPLVVLAGALAIAVFCWPLYQMLPRELTPNEDRGVVFVPLTAPQGSTLEHTDQAARQVEDIASPFRDSGEIETIFTFSGFGNRAYRSFVVFRLAPWSEREIDNRGLIRQIAPRMGEVTIARGFPVSPAGLGLRGSSTPLSIVVGGPDFESVKGWANEILRRAQENPRLINPEIDFEENEPQISLIVDRARADDLGISVETIASTLQTLLASREVTTYISRGREYPVILQADLEDRRSPSDISNIFIRSGDGTSLVPLGALVTMSESAAAASLRRYDRLPSIQISAALAEGYDLGSAIDFMRETAAGVLPAEAKLALAGQSQQFEETAQGANLVFGLALLIVFLVLAAQFESFIHPLVILLTVPLGVAGAVYAMALGGLSFNVYSQIGIVLLIGLMAKNGILIVEFANQLRDEGQSVREAVVNASVLRLRPIVMTVISTVLGALPLVLASGAGAESRIAIGSVIIGGLTLSSVLTLVLTPVLYDLLARFTRPRGAVEKALEDELGAAVRKKGGGAQAEPGE
ncbi:efflux RND transporter permease subunit [Stappia sp. F7233]|uniref:Efflux RND transporter permease subunit n=1 Tax=Stappia albiluteola TaxID=2758565 RepID=A0A839AF19_9HYPH|nr:efflux RND transporter permease subunit [Stappia albiluteola]MBA5778430.1 efflux RND transporter permease subunit [Stappia albiluteola]